ncbi:MAG: hypothetical protein KatS3mg125_1571 [Lysobacterales bacterium]|jgi:DNA recombination protein RmuC|nr:MAG: hypothetical protein KatS3mg125_1571 [Xanthomonadales bacterium]
MSLEAPLILLLAVGFLLALADALRGRLRLAALRAENEWQQRRLEERELALSEAQRRVATSERLAEERGQALARLEPVADRERELREAQARLLSELEGARQREAELAVRLEEERRRGAEKLALLEEASRRLGESFENLAQRIFEEKIARFSQQGGERLEQLIRPLREDLGGFRALVESGFRLEAEQRGFLRGELEQLRRLNERLSAEAESLAKALRGEFRTRGLWGEMILERVLESAGLEKGREFLVQESLSAEDGRRLRPDVIVMLPENRQVLIDAKAPLEAYLRACEASDEETRQQSLAAHARAVRAHLVELAGRGYDQAAGGDAVEMVLMFVPSEAALAEALRLEPALQADALERRIALVGPNTLLAMLRAVAFLWRLDAQSRNAREIARQAGALYDKFAAFVEDLGKVGEALAKAQAAHQAAFAKLSSGKGNLIGRVERLRALGASPKRALPSALEPDEESEEAS